MSFRKPFAIRTDHFHINLRFEILGLDSEFRNLQSEIENYWAGMRPATTSRVKISSPVLASS